MAEIQATIIAADYKMKARWIDVIDVGDTAANEPD